MGKANGKDVEETWTAPDPILHTPDPDWEVTRLLVEIAQFNGQWERFKRIDPVRLDRLRSDAAIQSVASSTRIEGANVSDADVKQILSNITSETMSTRDIEEVRGYAELQRLIFQQPADLELTENYLKQFHNILLKYSQKDQRHRGEYKTVANVISVTTEGMPDRVLLQPASTFQTRLWMPRLIAEFNSGLLDDAWNPLVLIAAFVMWFLAIHPFMEGNGRLARLLTTLLLLRTGHDWIPFASLERVIEDHRGEYYIALNRSQLAARQDPRAYGEWLVFFLKTLRLHQKALEGRLAREGGAIGMTRLHREILGALAELRLASAPALAKLLEVPARTIRHNLSQLVKLQLVEYEGERRGRVYRRAALAEATTDTVAPAMPPNIANADGSISPRTPTPSVDALFYSPPNARPYASIIIEADPTGTALLDDDAMDAFDAWVIKLRPDAVTWQSVPQVVRWHVPRGPGGDEWQASVQPGPRIDIHWSVPVVPRDDGGTAIPMVEVWRFWIESMRELRALLSMLNIPAFRMRLSQQTYPSGQAGVVDIDFAPISPPRRGAPPAGTPPWSYFSEPLRVEVPLRGTLSEAADSLMRHFSYRRVERVLEELSGQDPE